MGAHSLGQNHKKFSGYVGQFTEGLNRQFGNNYYTDMFDSTNTWTEELLGRTDKWQYTGNDAEGNQVGVRLHTDFELLYKITLNDDDSASCTLSDCELADTYDLAAEYASVSSTLSTLTLSINVKLQLFCRMPISGPQILLLSLKS